MIRRYCIQTARQVQLYDGFFLIKQVTNMYFKEQHNKKGELEQWTISISGFRILRNPILNKGCAFDEEERSTLNLIGCLPHHVETLEEQAIRFYQRFQSFTRTINQHIFLKNIFNYNQTLFFRLVSDHLVEMLPIIYTPVVGDAVKSFSHEFSHTRGLYLTYPDMDKMETMMNSSIIKEAKLIIVTDGEGVLGIGDQGIGGMYISIAKGMVYTLCGGIAPYKVTPIQLDVGTNNERLLKDPMYLGWRHPRLDEKTYDTFIKKFVTTLKKINPNVYLHWEDLAAHNAQRVLMNYRDKMCTFNDDMQGTGAVTLATILAASGELGRSLTEQRFVILGAGTAGMGIGEQIVDAMKDLGMKTPHSKFWLIDRDGLLTTKSKNIRAIHKPYLRPAEEVKDWAQDEHGLITLETVVREIRPTILIGCSTKTGAFTEAIIKKMHEYTPRPIILPLSNPTANMEATPKDLLQWTDGQALIATGSPCEPVEYNNKTYPIPQCNNAYVFPGLALGAIAVQANKVTDGMIHEACNTLSRFAPRHEDGSLKSLLPELSGARTVSKKIALAVAKKAMEEGHAQIKDISHFDLERAINLLSWEPKYLPYNLEKKSKK
jgi:malate dehydrogenase (oxaloacetate-decarboxylating)